MNVLSKSVALAVLVAGTAHAEPENITWGELALTHPVCYHVQAIPITGWTKYARESPQSALWSAMLGGDDMLWSMHHYCWALIHLRRADAVGISPEVRKYLIGVAISDFHYVVRYAMRLPKPEVFLMLPELWHRIGDANALLGQTAAAIDAYEQARRVKPDYWPPYVGQAKLLEKGNMRKNAMRLLEQGLQLMPGEPNIAAAYVRMGGKPASVAPAASAVAPPAATVAAPLPLAPSQSPIPDSASAAASAPQ